MAAVQEAPAPKLEDLSFRAQWAAQAIRTQIGEILNVAGGPKADENHILPAQDSFETKAGTKTWNVAIVGAGAAGLFTAMTLDFLKEKYNLDVNYTILEANGEDRVGGRLYTYKFPDKPDVKDYPKVKPHDYYDVGAMRFPEVPVMKRTFQLFDLLKMKKNPNTSKTVHAEEGELIKYYFVGEQTPLLYNNVHQIIPKGQEPTGESFKITGLPDDIAKEGCSSLADDPIAFYKAYFDSKGAKAFWKLLMRTADPITVRQYFTQFAGYDYNTIEFLETMNFGNRWYDQAVSEMILESLDFNPTADWWCVEGGAQQIAYRMKKEVKHQEKIRFGKTVKTLSYVDETCTKIKLTLQGQEEKDAQVYDSVFNSVPLGAMQHMQLEGLNLNWGTKQAIRSLGYGASCKVGVRFKTLWWIKKFGITEGGIAKTDLPIRCCVYPSYNIHDPVDQPGVLLVSYTWSQEAERIGSLINRHSPADEDALKEVLFHDLARLHCRPGIDDYQQLYTDIKNDYLDHYAKNWYDDATTVGAFAFFGPGQFKGLYPWITRNSGRHIIIGEAASAHHAWVVGSLESAVRGVYNFLCMAAHAGDAAAQAAFAAYNLNSVDGENPEIPGPYGPLPAEYDRTDDIGLNSAQARLAEQAPQTAPVGELARWQVEIEKLRLKQGRDQLDAEAISEAKIRQLVGAPPPTPPGND